MGTDEFKTEQMEYLKKVLEGNDQKVDVEKDTTVPLFAIDADVSGAFARREVTAAAIRKLFPTLVLQSEWSTGLANHCSMK